jgi:dienelactone hydrolase
MAAVVVILLWLSPVAGADLADDLAPLWECMSGKRAAFCIAGTLRLPARHDGRPGDTVQLRLARYDAAAFDLEASHPDYALTIHRRARATAIALPRHGRVYIGRGAVDARDHIAPEGLDRFVSFDSAASIILPALADESPAVLAALAVNLVGVKPLDKPGAWAVGSVTVQFEPRDRVTIDAAGWAIELALSEPGEPPAIDAFPGLEVVTLSREELEWTIARGVRRATEILMPGPTLVAPDRKPREATHGRLRWEGDQRVVTLWGSPEEIGTAHGELLATESWRCIDSVLGVVGIVDTVRTGRWFRHRLEEARDRLGPHIPKRHARESAALATAIGFDPHLFAAVNVFPELFHCSGFAVTGSATSDGTLYHGRVLDYMTQIGLQDAAAVFVVAPHGHIPFASVGYAGFTGSVTGMNAAGVSLGEMGGGGEGQWDGVPMAALMRRGLEECRTLDETLELWRTSPRTCEYFYVFADAKGRRAVGVGATPEALEVVRLGAAHPRLGAGLTDAVVLSSGNRLETLRERIVARHGRLDTPAAMRLMDRPVATASNLHNVLLVPERLELHVAHATHNAVAAERPAVRIDVAAVLKTVPREALRRTAIARPIIGASFPAADSLRPATDERPDARACLQGLVWEPGVFNATLHAPEVGRGDFAVEFPSPRPEGDPRNDSVWMEWYAVRDQHGEVARAPACVVVHESGSRMTFGRLIAKGLREHGIHAFVVHLPHYGRRRDPVTKPGPAQLVLAVTQAVADVRRARDAVAALPCVDGGRICLQGTSLGGFVATTAAAIDRCYAKTLIMLAGADLPSVLAHGQKDAAKVRAKLIAAGMSDEQIRDVLHAIEPLRLAHRLPPDRTWLYSALFDDVVPPHNAALLAKAAGLPERHHVRLAADHYTGILYLPVILAQIAGHMLEPP